MQGGVNLRRDLFGADSAFRRAVAAGGEEAASAESLFLLLQKMLSPQPRQRPPLEEFARHVFFADKATRALRFLWSLHDKEVAQQQQFLAGFCKLLQTQPLLQEKRLLKIHIILPLLEALQYPALYPHLLPCILFAVKKVRRLIARGKCQSQFA